ncbi:transcriptional regulator TAC1-like [Gastrolobium bilobum]|uniref:transcriptional regulator TAC1-like n=1 Tax=Gastrolobium bilobum TaxID=150636 RepID=UPI002AB0BE95|nr:transcriptional regulator TAC1-like [Gastrolobium bilobum]
MVGSENCTEEIDQQEEQDDFAVTKRSYDCTICKRGFTNARALGGHMNIHRKERIKAKQCKPKSSLSNNFTNEEHLRYILESQRNDGMYIQTSKPNPRNHYPPAYTIQYEFLNTKSESLIRNQELLGTNLSFQIGSSHVDTDQVMRGIVKDGEGVDLELRLGHNSYSNY